MYFYKMKRFLACIDYKTMIKVKQNALLYWCENFWPIEQNMMVQWDLKYKWKIVSDLGLITAWLNNGLKFSVP